jgi:small GTP-binding protein
MSDTPSFRLILVGQSGAGKTSLTQRLVQNVFYSEHVPTLGVDFQRVTFTAEETGAPTPISCSTWDSAGQETFLSITQQFIRGADAAFLCFDVTDSKSYQMAISNWRERVSHEKGGNILLVLVGTKADLEGMRSVQKSEAAAWAAEHKIPYFETSAKENQNVRSTFAFVAKALYDKKKESGGGLGGGGGVSGGPGKAAGGGGNKVNLAARVSGPAGADGTGAAAGGGGASGDAKQPGGCRC